MNIPYSAIAPFEPLGFPPSNDVLVKSIADHLNAWFTNFVINTREPKMSDSKKCALATMIRIKMRDIPTEHGATTSSSVVHVKRDGCFGIIGFEYSVIFKIHGKEYTCQAKQQFVIPATNTHWGYP